MDWLFVALGVALVLAGGYDVFHTLLNPSGRGTISRAVFALSWAATRRAGRWGVAVGPVAVVLTIGAWAALQIVGWALIYLPSIPDGFAFSHDLPADDFLPLWEALYFSGATLTTLGFGDTVPSEQWLRVIAPIEALAGFALLSASATWFLQLHGALARRRALALRLSQLDEAEFASGLGSMPRQSAAVIIESIAAHVAEVRVDFVQSGETYYFRELDARASLSTALPTATAIAEAAQTSPDADVRQSGRVLRSALDDLAELLRDVFLSRRVTSNPSTPALFAAYAADHRRGGTRGVDA